MPKLPRPTRPIVAKSLARVSSEQQRDNTSLEEQHRRNAEYIAAKGYTHGGNYEDVISGASVQERAYGETQFKRILDEAAADPSRQHVIVVTRRDRLGRGEAASVLEFYAQQHGVKIEYAQSSQYDQSTTEGLALQFVTDFTAGLERLTIRNRMLDGKQAVLRAGKHLGMGKPQYGYDLKKTYIDGRKISSEYVFNDKINVFFRICDMVEQGLSCRKICATLEADGILSPTGGGRWHIGVVFGMLTNPAYSGTKCYNVHLTKLIDHAPNRRIHRTRRPEHEQIKISIPAAITPERQTRLISLLRRHNGGEFKRNAHNYTLGGFMFCGRCGHKMIGTASRAVSGKVHYYYRCSDKFSKNGKAHCHARLIRVDRAESLIWGKIVSILTTDTFVDRAAHEMKVDYGDAIEQLRHSIDRLRHEMQNSLNAAIDLEKQIATETDPIRRSVKSSAQDGFYRRINEAKGQIDQNTLEVARLESLHRSAQDFERIKAEIRHKINDPALPATVKSVFESIELRIIYDSDKQILSASSLLGSFICLLSG